MHTIFRRHVVLCAAAMLAMAQADASPAQDRFSVQVSGSGPDVIFVHGLGCSEDVWKPVVAGLGGRYRVHLVQIAGFAGSAPAGNAHGSICSATAGSLAAYIAAAGLKRPALVGHSMGGTIGLMVAARHPEALGRLMVVDMFPALAVVMTRPGASAAEIEATALAIGGGMEHADDAGYRKSLDENLSGMILTASARPEIKRQGMASDHGVAGRAMAELIRTDLTAELPRIDVPVTVVYAWNKSAPYSAAQADGLYHGVYAGLRGVKLVRIDDSAHFIFIDQPARFQAALMEFLTA